MSWQAGLVSALARRVLRPWLARRVDVPRLRRRFERAATLFQRPAPMSLVIGGVVARPGLWVANRPTEAGVILYFHGGAYVMGSARSHAALASHIACRTGLRVFLPDYALAPEHPFPAAFQDALAAFDALVQQGHDPRRIILGGDSAGGGLALALLAHLCRAGRPPAGLFAFSPWTDLTFSGASLVTNAARDLLLPAHRMTEIRSMILGGARPGEADDPRLSPLHATFPGAPPVQIHVAETEILRDDALRMRHRLPDAEIRLAGNLPHAWPFLHGWLPEADETLNQTAAFIRSCLPPESGES